MNRRSQAILGAGLAAWMALASALGAAEAPAASRRGALFVSSDAPPVALQRPIPWSTISEVQTGHTMTGRGAVLGAQAGVGVGAALVTVFLLSRDQGGDAGGLAAISDMAGSALIGGFIGASVDRSHGRWRTIYRADDGAGR